MALIITRYDAAFTVLNTIFTLTLPAGEEEVALRVYLAEGRVSAYVLDTPVTPPRPTYDRHFMLIAADQDVTTLPLAATYVKYIETIPVGPTFTETHIIEVTPAPAEPTGFNVEQVS